MTKLNPLIWRRLQISLKERFTCCAAPIASSILPRTQARDRSRPTALQTNEIVPARISELSPVFAAPPIGKADRHIASLVVERYDCKALLFSRSRKWERGANANKHASKNRRLFIEDPTTELRLKNDCSKMASLLHCATPRRDSRALEAVRWDRTNPQVGPINKSLRMNL
jgi:hypothetical protein